MNAKSLVIIFLLLLPSCFISTVFSQNYGTVDVEGEDTFLLENGTFQIESISISDNATLRVRNAKLIFTDASGSYKIQVRDGGKIVVADSTLIGAANTTAVNIGIYGSGTNTITNSNVSGSLFVFLSSDGSIRTRNSDFINIGINGEGTVFIDNSTADTGYISGRDNVKIQNSNFGIRFDLSWGSRWQPNLVDSTINNLKPGLIESWSTANDVNANETPFALELTNTRITSWRMDFSGLNGTEKITLRNSELTYVTCRNMILNAFNCYISILNADAHTMLTTCNVSVFNMDLDISTNTQTNYSLEMSNSTIDDFNLSVLRGSITFSGLDNSAENLEVYPQNRFGEHTFVGSYIESWNLLTYADTVVRLTEFSKVASVEINDYSTVVIDKTSTVEEFSFSNNQTGRIEVNRVYACKTTENEFLVDADFQLFNLNTVTDADGEVPFKLVLQAQNYTNLPQNLTVRIEKMESSLVRYFYENPTAVINDLGNYTVPRQYYLEVNTDFRTETLVDGWYNEGEKIQLPTLETELLSNGTKAVFLGWQVDLSESAVTSITMNEPKTITAVWKLVNEIPEVLLILAVIVVVAVVSFTAYYLIQRMRRNRKNPYQQYGTIFENPAGGKSPE